MAESKKSLKITCYYCNYSWNSKAAYFMEFPFKPLHCHHCGETLHLEGLIRNAVRISPEREKAFKPLMSALLMLCER